MLKYRLTDTRTGSFTTFEATNQDKAYQHVVHVLNIKRLDFLNHYTLERI
jgi:hypothetical protein